MRKLKIPLLIFLSFVLVVPIGTLSHEMGHVFAAEILGYDTEIYYASMDHHGTGSYFFSPTKDDFLISLFGPLQSIVVSFIGLYFIRKGRVRKIGGNALSMKTLLLLLLALFAGREIFICLQMILLPANSITTDESKIADFLKLDPNLLSVIILTVAILICSYAVIKCVERKFWLRFVLLGALGSFIGFYLWMEVFGPFFF